MRWGLEACMHRTDARASSSRAERASERAGRHLARKSPCARVRDRHACGPRPACAFASEARIQGSEARFVSSTPMWIRRLFFFLLIQAWIERNAVISNHERRRRCAPRGAACGSPCAVIPRHVESDCRVLVGAKLSCPAEAVWMSRQKLYFEIPMLVSGTAPLSSDFFFYHGCCSLVCLICGHWQNKALQIM
jgi:hypothetical protein